ncbi:MAG: thioredoxin family protein [Saprospirales bacterium]|nr:thioredoxin family protein [Saprospirales bacterium]
MKNILSILLILFCTMIFAEDGIRFEEKATWQQVLDKAKKENKFILVDCYTTWCGPCKWMTKEVFPKAAVGEAINPNYISSAFDMEKGEGLELAKKFNIKNYPTYVFLNSNGEIVHRGLGSMPAEDFIKLCTDALNPDKQYITLRNKYISGNRDIDFLKNFSYVAADAQDSMANEVFASYLNEQKDLLSKDNIDMIVALTRTVHDAGFPILQKNKDKFIASIGEKAYNTSIEELVWIEAKKAGKKGTDPAGFKKVIQQYLPEKTELLSAEYELSVLKRNGKWKEYVSKAEKFALQFCQNDPERLNDIANNLLENFKDKTTLQKALKISLQAVKIESNFINNATTAEIYTKLGNKKTAKPYAEKAVEQAKIAGEDVTDYEKILKATN